MRTTGFVIALSLLLVSAPSTSAQSTVTVEGLVVDAYGHGLREVVITADEIGIRSEPDEKGNFRIPLPRKVAESGVRLHFESPSHFPSELDLPRLPHPKVKVVLFPFYTNAILPALPTRYSRRLEKYRAQEIQEIRKFQGDAGKRLMVVDGLPGQGAADLVITALQRPADQRLPVFWWECDSNDEVLRLASELGKAAKNPHLAELALAAQRPLEGRSRQQIAQIVINESLGGLDRSPRLLVFQHFERWLDKDTHRVVDPELTKWLSQLVTRSPQAKVILIADETPVLPHDIQAPWRARLTVGGLAVTTAMDYLKNGFGVNLDPLLLEALAKRYEGNPSALQLVASLLSGLSQDDKESQVRELLATGVRLPKANLQELLGSLYARLSADEKWALDLLGLVREPLTSDDLQAIDSLTQQPHPGRLSPETLDSLHSRLHLAAKKFSGSPATAHYYAPELVRDYINQLPGEHRARRRQLHGALTRWYQSHLPPLQEPLSAPTPSPMAIQQYDELAYHAFSVAELSSGAVREKAAMDAAMATLVAINGHAMLYENRFMIARLEQALRLLEGQTTPEALILYADCASRLGYILILNDIENAERRLRQAEEIYKDLGSKRGLANIEFVRAENLLWAYRLAEAETALRAAAGNFRSLGDGPSLANALFQLGTVELMRGAFEAARRSFEESLALFDESKDNGGRAKAWLRLGQTEQGRHEFTAALERYEKAEQVARELGPSGSLLQADILTEQANINIGLAEGSTETASRRGLLDLAQSKFREALQIFRELEEPWGEANCVFGLAYVRYVRKDPDALHEVRRARDLFKEINDVSGLIRSGFILSSLLNQGGRRAEAADEFLAILVLSGRSGTQTAEVVQIGTALYEEAGRDVFDQEVNRRLQALTADDRQVAEPLLEQIRKGGPGK